MENNYGLIKQNKRSTSDREAVRAVAWFGYFPANFFQTSLNKRALESTDWALRFALRRA
ncbi:MAG: hypothetical protein HW380_178 [Magnetococcales bacterium]|nr:hypothetical protein [Magnetococcales bacterium]